MLISDIIKEAARVFHVHEREIMGRCAMTYIVPVRHAVFTALHERGRSYKKVGKVFGRDHSGVIYGVKKAKDRMEHDEVYAARINHLINYGKPNLQAPVERGPSNYVISNRSEAVGV